MTLVWLSPGLPVDRVELADALPPDLTLVEPGRDHVGAGVDALPVGSLCVATVYESSLLDRLAFRPGGVGLLVVAPPGQPLPYAGPGSRPIDAVATTTSVGELVTALRRATGWTEPAAGDEPAAAAAASSRTRPAWLRGRLAGIAAILVGLAVGGVVVASTEGSAATATGGGGGQFAPPGTGAGGAGTGGAGTGSTGTGSTGTGGTGTGTSTFQQQLLTCLQKQGLTGDLSQLRQQAADPKVRAALQTCLQQSGSTLPGGAGVPSQSTGRP